MRTVTSGLSSRQKTNKRLLEAFRGKSQGEFISFESPALLFKVLSGNRWELLKVMTGAGYTDLHQPAEDPCRRHGHRKIGPDPIGYQTRNRFADLRP